MAGPSRRRRRGGDFVPDHESFGRFMLSEQAAKPVMLITNEIAQTARVTTPRSNKAHQHVADAYEVHPVVVAEIGDPPGPRIVGEITNSAPAALANEFGTERMRGNRSLRKAAEPWHDPKVTK